MKKLLGKRIAYFRGLKGLSQRELASALKVDKQTIWRLEVGRTWPQYDNIAAIAKALGVAPDELFGMSEEPTEPTAEQLVSALFVALSDPEIQSLFVTVLRSHRIGNSE